MRTWTEWVSLGQLPDSPCFSFLVLSAFQSRTWTLSQIAFKCPGPWHKTQAHRSGKFRDSRPNMTPENKHDFLAKRTCKICEPSFCLEVLEVLLGSSCWWRYFGVFEDHLEDPRNTFYRVHHIRNQKGGSWTRWMDGFWAETLTWGQWNETEIAENLSGLSLGFKLG